VSVILVSGLRTAMLAILFPHSKGSNYLMNVMNYRSGPNIEELDGIDDIRNGLLLSSFLHREFGDGSLAFLKVRPPIFICPSTIFLTTKIMPPQQAVPLHTISLMLGLV